MTVIAIDGPAGSGKSTVSRGVAQALGLEVLDTGAMYRAATVAAMRAAVDLEDAAAVVAVVQEATITVGAAVLVNGQDVTETIRTPEVTAAVSLVARIPAVRSLLVAQQRAWAEVRGGGVVEGRDITSVVFPDAPVRIYLYADPDVRAQRRGAEEAEAKRIDEDRNIAAELETRDTRDATLGRVVRPDQVPDGVTVVDTSHQGVEEIVATIVAMAKESA